MKVVAPVVLAADPNSHRLDPREDLRWDTFPAHPEVNLPFDFVVDDDRPATGAPWLGVRRRELDAGVPHVSARVGMGRGDVELD